MLERETCGLHKVNLIKFKSDFKSTFFKYGLELKSPTIIMLWAIVSASKRAWSHWCWNKTTLIQKQNDALCLPGTLPIKMLYILSIWLFCFIWLQNIFCKCLCLRSLFFHGQGGKKKVRLQFCKLFHGTWI